MTAKILWFQNLVPNHLESLQPDDLQAKPIDYQGCFGERCENELITCCLWIRYQLQVTV